MYLIHAQKSSHTPHTSHTYSHIAHMHHPIHPHTTHIHIPHMCTSTHRQHTHTFTHSNTSTLHTYTYSPMTYTCHTKYIYYTPDHTQHMYNTRDETSHMSTHITHTCTTTQTCITSHTSHPHTRAHTECALRVAHSGRVHCFAELRVVGTGNGSDVIGSPPLLSLNSRTRKFSI